MCLTNVSSLPRAVVMYMGGNAYLKGREEITGAELAMSSPVDFN